MLSSIFVTLLQLIGHVAFVFVCITYGFPATDPAYAELEHKKPFLSDIDRLKQLVSQKKKIQSSVSQTVDNEADDKDEASKLIEKRKNIRAEILSTERTYVHNLRILHDTFLVPIREKRIMSESVIDAVFSRELVMILNINQMFLNDLEKILNVGSSRDGGGDDDGDALSNQLAELLLKNAHLFKLYIGYVSHYSTSISVLRSEVESNKKLNQFLSEKSKHLQNSGERAYNLSDYLINPIQRLPRYRLLFQDLLQKTEPHHPSYQKLSKAVELIKNVIKDVNEKEGELKNQMIMIDLQKKLKHKVPEFIVPTRRLLRLYNEQNVSIVLENNKVEPCQFYIFSDLIVCIYVKKTALKKKEKVRAQYIVEHQITEKGRVDTVKVTPTGTSKQKANLKIETTYGSSAMLAKDARPTPECIHLSCPSIECRDDILQQLQKRTN